MRTDYAFRSISLALSSIILLCPAAVQAMEPELDSDLVAYQLMEDQGDAVEAAAGKRADTRAAPTPAMEPELGPDLDISPHFNSKAGNTKPEANWKHEGGSTGRTMPSVIVNLDGTESNDPDGDRLEYSWIQIGGPEVTLSDKKSARPYFRTAIPGAYSFALVVSDGNKRSDPAVVEVEVERPNLTPEAIVEEEIEVSVGKKFVIDGSESRDADGDRLSYQWKQISGPPLFLKESETRGSALPLTFDREAVYEFELTVWDGNEFSRPAVCRVKARPANRAPVAQAKAPEKAVIERPAEQKTAGKEPGAPVAVVPWEVVATIGEEVTIDGSRSFSPRQRELRYYWLQRGGPFIRTLRRPDGNEAKISFTPEELGEYTFSLVVNDGEKDSAPQRVRVKVLEGNAPPVATIIGPEKGFTGGRITLDGSRSYDREKQNLTYRWRQASGPNVDEIGVDRDHPEMVNFIPRRPGAYAFELIVSDGLKESKPARAVVLVEKGNNPPSVEVAGSLRSRPGEPFLLQARGHDPEKEDLTYTWRQVGGPELLPRPAHQQRLQLTAEKEGIYQFEVTVNDGSLSSVPGRCEVRVKHPNRAPVALARREYSVEVGEAVKLDGRASHDPDGDKLSYLWQPASQHVLKQGTLSDARQAVASFTPAKTGKFELELTVSDAETQSEPLSVTVTATPANSAPLVRLVAPDVIAVGDVAVLDGSFSSDPEKADLTYTWKQLQGPTIPLSRRDRRKARLRLTPEKTGEYVFELTVSDGKKDSSQKLTVKVEE